MVFLLKDKGFLKVTHKMVASAGCEKTTCLLLGTNLYNKNMLTNYVAALSNSTQMNFLILKIANKGNSIIFLCK